MIKTNKQSMTSYTYSYIIMITYYILCLSTSAAISFSLGDSNAPVLSTIDLNTDWRFCSRLNGVSNSITLPDDKTCEESGKFFCA